MNKTLSKTIIFIIDRGIQMISYIDLLSAKEDNSFRLVAIINSSSYENMDENDKILFDKIYVIKDIIANDNLCQLNYEDLHELISNELKFINNYLN